MSQYSLDSLENVEEDSLEKSVSVNDKDNDDTRNLRAVKSVEEFESDSFYLDPILMTSGRIRGTKDAE